MPLKTQGPTKTREIYLRFMLMFPNFSDDVARYAPFDHYSLKIDMKDNQIYIFTYRDDKNWALRTYKHYVENGRV